jgi:hypothetical protein
MIWRGLTIGLLLGCAALTAIVYLGSGAIDHHVAERSLAASDARQVLRMVADPATCSGRCSAQVIDRSGAHRWRVRLVAPRWERCFEIEVTAFNYSPDRGLSGLRQEGCR